MSTPEKKEKFNSIIKPYIFLSVGCVAVYSAVVWLIVSLKLPVPWLLYVLVLPIILPCILIFKYFRKRILLLKLNTDGQEIGLHILALLPIVAGTFFAASYITKNLEPLITLNTINDLGTAETGKCYAIKQYYPYKNGIGVKVTESTPWSKAEDTWKVTFTLAMPLYNTAADTIKHNSKVWLGYNYVAKFNAKEPKETLERKRDDFIQECYTDIEKNTFKDFGYMELQLEEFEKEDYLAAMINSDEYETDSVEIFEGIAKPYTERTGDTGSNAFSALLLGNFFFYLFVSFFKLKDKNKPHDYDISPTEINHPIQ